MIFGWWNQMIFTWIYHVLPKIKAKACRIVGGETTMRHAVLSIGAIACAKERFADNLNWWHAIDAIVDSLYLGKFHHDLTSRPNPGIMVSIGNHPQMAELFRLVKYYNLPRLYSRGQSLYSHIFCYSHTCVVKSISLWPRGHEPCFPASPFNSRCCCQLGSPGFYEFVSPALKKKTLWDM